MTWAIDLAILTRRFRTKTPWASDSRWVSLIARRSQYDRNTAFSEVIFICQRCKLSLQRGAAKVYRPSGGDEFESETTAVGASCKPASAAQAIKAFFDFAIVEISPVRKIVINNMSFNRNFHREDRWRLKASHLMRPLTVRFPDRQKVSVGSQQNATCGESSQEIA